MRQRLERALRTIAALPDDDWQPHHWDEFAAAQVVVRDELASVDRRASSKPRPERRQRVGGWTLPAAREVVRERSGGTCEANTVVCTVRAGHVHHKGGRVGHDPHNPEKLLHVCDACHRHIHANPAASYAQGWLLRRLGIYG